MKEPDATVEESASGEITKLLNRMSLQDKEDQQRLFERVYAELRAIAQGALTTESAGHTLTPTALVHEAYLRLCQGMPDSWRSRGEFYGYFATVVRHCLVDYARAKKSEKRGGKLGRLSLEDVFGKGSLPQERSCGLGLPSVSILDLDAALTVLEKMSPRQSKIIELHFFAGLPFPEVATTLDLAVSTVFSDWRIARAFLRSKLLQE